MSNKNRLGKQYMKAVRHTVPTLIGKRGTAQESRKWKDAWHREQRRDSKRAIHEQC